MTIINLTQHTSTAAQQSAGVVELSERDKRSVVTLITFHEIPEQGFMIDCATEVALIALENKATAAMIGGAPYFMGHLERALRAVGIKPVYSFTRRETVETAQADGSVKKESVFNHVGWVEA